jgi:chemotaxis protein methyltransferase CheR
LGLNGLHDLWVKVLKQPDFMQLLMNEISVGLTSMFRDPVLWKTLKSHVPSLAKNQPLRIWHAGCSSGEEVFTLSIVLKEGGITQTPYVLATDISQDAMNVARKGEYHKIKLLEFDNNYREYNPFGGLDSYYSRSDNTANFDSHLTRHVNYQYHNLITDPIIGKFDIILCRNVMIYFDTAAKIRLMEKFHKALRPGGLFVVGFYDAVSSIIDESLFEVWSDESKIFKAKEVVGTTAMIHR